MGVEEVFAKFGCEGFEGVAISEKFFLIIFNPIIDLNVLEGHKRVTDFVFVFDFTLVEVGIEVL